MTLQHLRNTIVLKGDWMRSENVGRVVLIRRVEVIVRGEVRDIVLLFNKFAS